MLVRHVHLLFILGRESLGFAHEKSEVEGGHQLEQSEGVQDHVEAVFAVYHVG